MRFVLAARTCCGRADSVEFRTDSTGANLLVADGVKQTRWADAAPLAGVPMKKAFAATTATKDSPSPPQTWRNAPGERTPKLAML